MMKRKILYIIILSGIFQILSIEAQFIGFYESEFDSITFHNNYLYALKNSKPLEISQIDINHLNKARNMELHIKSQLTKFTSEVFPSKDSKLFIKLYDFQGFKMISEYYYYDLTTKLTHEVNKDEFAKNRLTKKFLVTNRNSKIPINNQYNIVIDQYYTSPIITNGIDVANFLSNENMDNVPIVARNAQRNFFSVSMNNFYIAFIGWSGEYYETSQVGRYKGLFVFNIIYDGIILKDSILFKDIDETKQIISIPNNSEVKLKDKVGDYYICEFENIEGYIRTSDVAYK